MDLKTGKLYEGDELIKRFRDEQEFQASMKERLIEVSKEDATEKQLKEMQVSLKDTKSKLGKKLHKERKAMGWPSMTKNQKRNMRKKN